MKFEILVLGITGLLVANAYYDGKYLKLLMSWKKYYQMAFIAFMGVSVYWFMKQNPNQSASLVSNATNFIKHMPMDKDAGNLFGPLMSGAGGFGGGGFGAGGYGAGGYGAGAQANAVRKMSQSGRSTKRSVSETKKKYVASQQQWHCGDCKNQLSAWFEVDHKKRLDQGGTNELDNLVALCRECHGKKTAMENL